MDKLNSIGPELTSALKTSRLHFQDFEFSNPELPRWGQVEEIVFHTWVPMLRFLKCVVCSAQNELTRYPQEATVSHLSRSSLTFPGVWVLSSTAGATGGGDKWVAMICSSMGKQPLPSLSRQFALPDLLTPGLWARAPSFLLWLFPTLCAGLGLVSHLWQVEQQRFMQHVLLLWE